MEDKLGKISDSEWKLMELIWAREEGWCTQAMLMEQLGDKWNKNTIHTFLKRLCDKGYLTVQKDVNPHRYIPMVGRQACEREERISFLERVYQGNAGRMVASFVRDGGLSREEVDELKKLLDEL